jgi:hypothetical protein
VRRIEVVFEILYPGWVTHRKSAGSLGKNGLETVLGAGRSRTAHRTSRSLTMAMMLRTSLANSMSWSKEGATRDVVDIVGGKFGLCEMIGHERSAS